MSIFAPEPPAFTAADLAPMPVPPGRDEHVRFAVQLGDGRTGQCYVTGTAAHSRPERLDGEWAAGVLSARIATHRREAVLAELTTGAGLNLTRWLSSP